ncbi:MAG: hypothetical protein LBJ73_02630 [Rickettsiales bacterium]|jgi:hypothetical protein|nr:hypothetical protein [Rickettsiales bacterium]
MKKIIAALMLTLLVATDLMADTAYVGTVDTICYTGPSYGDYRELNTAYDYVNITYTRSDGNHFFTCTINSYACRPDKSYSSDGCTDCPTGSVATPTGKGYNSTIDPICRYCIMGYYRDVVLGACVACPYGGTSSNRPEDNSNIIACSQEAGTYTDDTGTYDLSGTCNYEE